MTAETEDLDPTASVLAFFGSEVTRLRGSTSQTELASDANTTQPVISRVERGRRVPSADLAADLDTALKTDGHFTRLHPLVLRYAYPSWFLPYVELEREAFQIRTFESQVIPGLLQTEDYARAILASGRPDCLQDLVAARMSRQAVLEGEERPRAWFVVDEQALCRPVGGPEAMRDQLAHLLKAAEEPRTVIQVIPRRVATHPGLEGPFTVMDLDKGRSVLYVDGFSKGRLEVDTKELVGAAHAYDLLRAVALSPEESSGLISRYVEEHANDHRKHAANSMAEEQLQQ
ncbi:helix-turn-helix domain-containing protein [Streptomyces sp. NPDC057654]|uniref:helix-turn-helix domain-containing protein n=1 Tax=Streptomyces sp. NPDC057654 TaxID=3346196 RepID=UPI003683BCCF